MADSMGLDNFQHLDLEPVSVEDCAGRSHKFHLQSQLSPDGISVEAFEIRGRTRTGYRFQVMGSLETDVLHLVGRLIEKMRRALATKDLETGDLGVRIAKQTVRAQIEWDDDCEGELPLLIIDGRSISWYHFGRMLMTFEGWNFRMEIKDPSDEP
jgi:hypothetical protein